MRRSFVLTVACAVVGCSSSSSTTSSGATGQTSTSGATRGATTGATTAAGSTTGAIAATTGAATASTGAVAASTGVATTSGTASATTTGGSSSTSGTTGTAITADTFDQLLSLAFCTTGVTCEGYSAEITTTICPQYPTIGLSGLASAVDAGRVAFDAGAAALCLAALEDAGCNFAAVGLGCTTAVAIGLEPLDAGCFNSADCKAGSCVTTGATCSPGLCTPYVESGGACDCSGCGICDPTANLTCSPSTNTCQALGQQGASCPGNGSCVPGFDCIGNVCTAIPVAPGDPCVVNNSDCQPGSYCFELPMQTVGNCSLQVALGQPCGQNANYQSHVFGLPPPEPQCAGFPGSVACIGAGTLVDGGIVPGVCGALSDEGGPCVAAGPGINTDAGAQYQDGCKLGLNCVAGVCTRPPASGACSPLALPCDVTVAFCDATTNTCQPTIPLGGSCDGGTNQCGLVSSCSSNDICQLETNGCPAF